MTFCCLSELCGEHLREKTCSVIAIHRPGTLLDPLQLVLTALNLQATPFLVVYEAQLANVHRVAT